MNTVIPKAHYFTKPTKAVPGVFNRVFDDINNAFLKLWDGSVVCRASQPFAVLEVDGETRSIAPNQIRFEDATFWPSSVENVNVSFALESSIGTLSNVIDNKYVTWEPPADLSTFTAPKAVRVKMNANYDVVFPGDEEFIVSTDNQTVFNTAHTVYDNTAVETFINGVSCTNSATNGNTAVTLTSGTTVAGDTVLIRYQWASSAVKESLGGFTIVDAPVDGQPAITEPQPAINMPYPASPLSLIDNVSQSRLTISDGSLTNSYDSITRNWIIYHEGVDVTSNSSYVVAESGSLGAASPTFGGTTTVTLLLKKSGNYTFELNIHSASYGTDHQITTQHSVMDFWNLGAVVVNPTYNTTDVPFITDVASDFIISVSAYNNTKYGSTKGLGTELNKALVEFDVIYRTEYEEDIECNVVNAPEGVFWIYTESTPLDRYGLDYGDVRPGIDVFYYKGYPYTINFVDTDTTHSSNDKNYRWEISNDFNAPEPGAGWDMNDHGDGTYTDSKLYGVGVLADTWIAVLEHKTSSSATTASERMLVEIPNKPGMDLEDHFKASFIVPYGGYINVQLMSRHGNVLSDVFESNPQALNIAASSPSISNIDPIDTNSNIFQCTWSALNAHFYELFYKEVTHLETYSTLDARDMGNNTWEVDIDAVVEDTYMTQADHLWFDGYPYNILDSDFEYATQGCWTVLIEPEAGSTTITSAIAHTTVKMDNNYSTVCVINRNDTDRIETKQRKATFLISNTNLDHILAVRGIDAYGRISSEKKYLILGIVQGGAQQ